MRLDRSCKVILLGVRGSVPVAGSDFDRYGGATSCVLAQMGGETILLDCGTGLLRAAPWTADGGRLTLLLSHPHVDHLLGLPFFPPLFEPGREIDFRTVPREGLGALEQARALLAPPLWPVGPEVFPADVTFSDILTPVFQVGPVTVDTLELPHPGGATAFRLSLEGRSLVYATDCELSADTVGPLAAFAGGCDLLLCDGQYSDDDYPARRGWGHSPQSLVAELGAACGARRTVLIHHAPEYTDDMLDEDDRRLRERFPGCSLGHWGEEFEL